MTVALLTFVGFSAFFVGLQLDAGRMSPRVRFALYVVALLAFVIAAFLYSSFDR